MTILFISDILYFISGFGILQGVLLSGLIYFHPKSDKSVNIFLSFYIFFITLVMTMPYTMNLVGWQNSFILQPLPMVPAIMLYFYLRSFKEKITWKKILPHLIPLIVMLLLSYINLSALKREMPDAETIPVEGLKRPLTFVVIIFRTIQQLIYFILSLKTLRVYQRSIQQLFSETSRIDLQWAKFLIYGFLVLILSFVVVFPLMLRFPEYFNMLLLLNMAIATPYIYIATYKGVVQPTIWQVQSGMNKETVEKEMHEAEVQDDQEILKTAKLRLAVAKLDEIAINITRLMEEEKPYLEPELTLQQLADKLQIPNYQVSQALNEGLQKSFYDLVNGYRVEEAKRLLMDPKNKNYTILSVGFEAGFNSKTTFNTVFKKFTGLTPTEFRDKGKLVVNEQ